MATKWFNSGTEHPSADLRKIVMYLRKVERPLFLGQIALEINYSLEQTESLLGSLTEKGLVRRLSEIEIKDLNLREHSVLYKLIRVSKGEL